MRGNKKNNKLFWASSILIFGAALFMINVSEAAIDNAATVAWGYQGAKGPAYWGSLSPDYQLCTTGKEQSPINITNAVKSRINTLQINYQPAPLKTIDDGYTILNLNGHQTLVNIGHTLQLNFDQNEAKETVKFNGDEYYLIQLHFHTPSETLINGQKFPMEIHFVNQSRDGKILVLAVFVETGNDNTALQTILEHLPKAQNLLYAPHDVNVSLLKLLPENKTYYSFTGSLTTPPCTQGLQWVVLEHPIMATAEQIFAIKKAVGENNARPIQPTNKRQILKVVE